MKYEGKAIDIPIKGILRAGSDNLNADGAMNEIIGMEYKDASWVVYKEKEVSDNRFILNVGTSQYQATDAWVHKLTNGDVVDLFLFNYPTLGPDSELVFVPRLYYYREDDEFPTYITDKVKDVAFIGNMLCVATDEGMHNFLWKNNSYVEQVKSNFPRVALRVSAGLYDKHVTNRVGMRFVTRAQFEATNGTIDKQTIDAEARDKAILSALTSARGSVTEEGGLTGYVVACVAYRLKNGFVVAADAPVLLGRPMQVHGDETSGYREYNLKSEYDSSFGQEGFDTSNDNSTIIQKRVVSGKENLRSSETDEYAIFQMPTYNESREYEDDDVNITKENSSFVIYSDKSVETQSDPVITYKICTVDNGIEEDPLWKDNFQPICVITDDQDYNNYETTDMLNQHVYSMSIIQNNRAYIPNLGCTFTRIRKHHKSTQGITPDDYKCKDLIIFSGYAAANKLQFKLSDVPESIEDNEIQSVCIFISPEISPYNLEKEDIESVVYEGKEFEVCHVENFDVGADYADLFTTVRYYPAKYRSMEEVIKDIYHINSLYLIKEIPRADIKNSDDWETVDLHGLLGETLLVRESLPVTAFNWMNTIPNHLATYNYRLHAYDYTQEFYKGYDLRSFYYYGENKMFKEDGGHGQIEAEDYIEEQGATYKWEIKVVLKDNWGNSTMVNYDDTAVTQLVHSLSPMITYPSVYADSMIINVYRYEDGSPVGGKFYQKEITLTRNDNLGIAYYVDPDLEPVLPLPLDNGLFPPSFIEPPEELPLYDADNTIRYHHNGLKASDSGFPNYFPEKMTYPIGNGKVIGTGLMSIPMSQDNYGVNQLLVFCTDGIYTLGVNRDGSGAYTDIHFESTEVCINRNTICELGSAIVFASAKGMMMYSANGMEEFIPALRGPIRFSPAYSDTTIKDGQHIYGKMITNDAIVQSAPYISGEDFIDFLRDEETHIVYVTEKHKLVIYNPSQKYCYFVDIASHAVTKLPIGFVCDDGNNLNKKFWHSERHRIDGHYVYQSSHHIFEYHSQEANVDCVIGSRPIKVQQDDKCSYRLVITGYFEGDEDKWAELVVLGSIDGDHWRVIGHKGKRLEGGFHNLGCTTERGTWKYLMFLVAGQFTNKCSIDQITLTADGRYNNKKR